MKRYARSLMLCVGLVGLMSSTSFAQAVAQAPRGTAAPPSVTSRWWLVAGSAFVALQGQCQTCETEYPHRHAGSALVDVGLRANARMDAGAELFWVPTSTESGRLNAVHIDAVAQFRPWETHGFFVKGGAGMVFVRNWVDAVGPDPIFQKGLSVTVGAGWAFRRSERVGFQVFGAQHAAALGDLQTATATVQDVIGNFWSVGAGLTIR